MPRTSPDDVPRLRVHPQRNYARVTLGGREFNCGRPGTLESQRRYYQLIGDWIDQGRPQQDYVPSFEAGADLTIGRVVIEYAKHLKRRWPDKANGTVHREFSSRRPILRLVRENFGDLPITKFGPKLFKRIRDLVIETDVSRRHVNETMARVRQMLKWAVSEEYIPGWQLEAVKAVTALRRGDVDGLRDNDPVEPIPDEIVDQTLPYLLIGANPFDTVSSRREKILPASGISLRQTDRLGKKSIGFPLECSIA